MALNRPPLQGEGETMIGRKHIEFGFLYPVLTAALMGMALT